MVNDSPDSGGMNNNTASIWDLRSEILFLALAPSEDNRKAAAQPGLLATRVQVTGRFWGQRYPAVTPSHR